MRQLLLDWGAARPQTLDNFVEGRNAELLSLLRLIAERKASSLDQRFATIWRSQPPAMRCCSRHKIPLAISSGRLARRCACSMIATSSHRTGNKRPLFCSIRCAMPAA